MDRNDPDLDWIGQLARWTPSGPDPVEIRCGTDMTTLPREIVESFKRAFPDVICPVIDGKTYIRPPDWGRFCRTQTEQAWERMRKRSLGLGARGPKTGDLEGALLLSHWILIRDPCGIGPGAVLLGTPAGHPNCVGPLTRTSRLCGLAEDVSWARTTSRWYRLAHPATVAEMHARFGPRVADAEGLVLPIWRVLTMLADELEESEFR